MIKANINFDLRFDLNNYFESYEDTESGEAYLKLKDEDAFEEELYEDVKNQAAKCILIDRVINEDEYKKLLKQLIDENKDAIINKIVDKVSKSLLLNKEIKDLRKKLND